MKNKSVYYALLFVTLFEHCTSKSAKQFPLPQNFDDSNYVNSSNVRGQNDVITMEIYRNKHDTAYYMVKKSWDNGNILSKMYFKHGVKSGPCKIYDTTGKIVYQGFFLNNKRTGMSLFFDNGSLTSIEMQDGDVKLNVDSTEQKAILSALSN